MSISPWARGFLFTGGLLILIFFLKIICPINVGCFADPFLVPIFSPLLLVELFTEESSREVLGSLEPLFIFIFWLLVGSLFGFLYGQIFSSKKDEIDFN